MAYTRNNRKRPRYLVVAHIDEVTTTLRDVTVPEIVPLYVDFVSQIGTARLRRRGKKIYAILEPDWNTKDFTGEPKVFLGWDNCTRSTENGVCYLDGGQVTCASIVSAKQWEKINRGKQ